MIYLSYFCDTYSFSQIGAIQISRRAFIVFDAPMRISSFSESQSSVHLSIILGIFMAQSSREFLNIIKLFFKIIVFLIFKLIFKIKVSK
jgi:hypothetical protein